MKVDLSGSSSLAEPASSGPAHRSGWHWPSFGQAPCGQTSDRERLGLPAHVVASRLEPGLCQSYARLRQAPLDTLLEIVSAADCNLVQRIAAGNLLALHGDPRLDTDRPAMHEVAGGPIEVGLPVQEVGDVMRRFAGLGLDRRWIEKETPRHKVTLARFRIARYPVTNLEYRAFLVATGHREIPSSWAFRQYPHERANHPVYTVSAASADAYAQWLCDRTGRGFRLPTEAEWEWAAAGPQAREFPWGTGFDADLANTAETGLFNTSPVGAFIGGESVFGICDMAGNVEEYVADAYAAYPGGPWIDDHLSQIHGIYRVARGGSFARFRDLARSCRRHGHNPRSATYAMGFRLAETP